MYKVIQLNFSCVAIFASVLFLTVFFCANEAFGKFAPGNNAASLSSSSSSSPVSVGTSRIINVKMSYVMCITHTHDQILCILEDALAKRTKWDNLYQSLPGIPSMQTLQFLWRWWLQFIDGFLLIFLSSLLS